MRSSRVKRKLRADEPVLITALQLMDPVVFEMASLLGIDALWLDMEHASVSLQTAADLIRAARVGYSDVLARPGKGEFMRMGRMLEAGAQGIMYPRCDNAEEASEVVRWAKFAPLGIRGFDSGNADNPYCSLPPAEYVQRANEETFLVIQLETPASLEHADDIAAVDGVDGIILGPADFSVLSGFPGQSDHPEMDEALQHIATAARRAGKHWGCPGANVSRNRQLLERGARLLFCGADKLMVKAGLEQLRDEFSQLGIRLGEQ